MFLKITAPKLLWSLFFINFALEIILSIANYNGWAFRRRFPVLVHLQMLALAWCFLGLLARTLPRRRAAWVLLYMAGLGLVVEIGLTQSGWLTHHYAGGWRFFGSIPAYVPILYFFEMYLFYLLAAAWSYQIIGSLPHSSKIGSWKALVWCYIFEGWLFGYLIFLNENIGIAEAIWEWNATAFQHWLGYVPVAVCFVGFFGTGIAILPLHLTDFFAKSPWVFEPKLRTLPIALLLNVFFTLLYGAFKIENYGLLFHTIGLMMVFGMIYAVPFIFLKDK